MGSHEWNCLHYYYMKMFNLFYTPSSTKLKGGILVSRNPSVCPSVRPSVCLPVRLWTESWLSQYLPYLIHIYTRNSETSKCASRVKMLIKFQNLYFFLIYQMSNFDFVLFRLMIWYESVSVIMGQRDVLSENRRSSCSSLYQEMQSFNTIRPRQNNVIWYIWV